ncbi:putative late blight resistance protein homolog R1A-3 [Nicotiana tabacum]|uniref:Late blight resistance protein homolog R1A-3 n=1 Tax=Nicotiana tabacum TaxID=4097 RepID=A0AC58UU88_TOBAC
MAKNVGQFCLALWINKDRYDTSDIESRPPFLLCLVVLVELEMKKLFLSEVKASKFIRSITFKDKKLPKEFSYNLQCLLVYLKNKKLENFPNNVSAQDIDVAIEFLLGFLADASKHLISGRILNEILEKVGSLVGDVMCVIQKLHPISIAKGDSSDINLCPRQILEKTENLKAQVEKYYKSFKFTPSQFPTVGGLSFLDSLLRKLNEMLKNVTCSDFMLKPHIVILEKELSSLTSLFRDVAEVHHKHEILKDFQRRTINLAYEAEIAIDSILSQYNALWHSFCSLPSIIEEVKHIRTEVTKMWSENIDLRPCTVVEPSKHLSIQHSNPMNDEEIVGFENDMKRIIRHLIQGTNGLDVIPIVGMGGQGKTTCARKLYNDDIIVSHFDVRAWCIISQTYNRSELLQELLRQVTNYKDEGDKDDVLADKLRKCLMGKRYLIVLDDMWDFMAWDELRLSFPNAENGSRMIVTTRLEKVGDYVMHNIDPYFLPFLTPEESCQLLQKKVFENEGCPPELEDASLAVAERCKGLPLVIVLVSGIIKKRKMEEYWWHEVKNSLFSYLGDSEEYSLSTMQLSYDNLPDHLKPYLLYMGMFPEDARIPVSKLISLWIAEGFVQNVESGRLTEEAAEAYLTDLISSNVVMVSRRRYNGKVKYCQIHDIVLHFCLEKSRKEKIMLAVKGHYSHFQPSDWKESRVRFSFSNELSEIASLGSKTRKPFHQHLRSVITTNDKGEFTKWNPFHQVSKLRLLKVLDLSSYGAYYLSLATFNPLIHLKYLAVSTLEFFFHPKSHLPHLETLIVKSNIHYSETLLLPAIFWKMEKLRHVEVVNLDKDKHWIFEDSSKLENLRILRKFAIDSHDAGSVDVLLRRCPNLQELVIEFRGDEEYSAVICPNFESLTQLQSLRLTINEDLALFKLHLPLNLKKLVLQGDHIERAISFIAILPSLEYLQLRYLNFDQHDEWCLGTGVKFRKLKLLKLTTLYISRWEASEESFPLLETLVIKGCYHLEEIPLSFADILTLKQIKLIRCNKESLEASAVRIKEEVEDTEGCNRIDLIIEKY